MVQFNDLTITPNGNCLNVEVSVKNEEYYNDILIETIVIDTQDTFISGGPSSKAIKVWERKEGDWIKEVSLTLNHQDLGMDLSTNIFFVYVIASGTPAPDTPCGMDNSITMGTVIDLYPIYRKSMYYLEEMNDSCNIPKDLIDNILRIKSLELSIKTGNYPKAIQYWNKWFKNIKTTKTNTCNCYGTGN